METTLKKSKGFDGHCNIYQNAGRGCTYNPCLREWELYWMDPDGSIQDLSDRVKTKREAITWIYAS